MRVDTHRRILKQVSKPWGSPDYLRELYGVDDFVEDYSETRFGTPLGMVHHEQQVSFVNYHVDACKARKILEIGIGPARLSAEIQVPEGLCLGVDASRLMLRAAKRRLGDLGNTSWELLHSDAFSLPFRSEYLDCVFAFRFVRHLKREDRSRVYSEIQRVLRTDGLFIFDAPNMGCADKKGVVYDQSWTTTQLSSEMVEEGFTLKTIHANIRYYGIQESISVILRALGLGKTAVRLIELVEDWSIDPNHIGQKPLEWLVLCQK